MRHQIAQKLHAVSDPHDPPASLNNRPRDVVDLILLRDLVNESGAPTLEAIRDAAIAVFTGRAAESEQLGLSARFWPPTVLAHQHWQHDYEHAAGSAALDLSLVDAVAAVNDWIATLDAAGQRGQDE